jgi:hypothetical protein
MPLRTLHVLHTANMSHRLCVLGAKLTWRRALAASAIASASLGGCVETTVERLPLDQQISLNQPSTITRVSLELQPLGAIPYDGYTLPITSHSGQTLITQVSSQIEFRAQLKIPADSPWASSFLDPSSQPTLVAATPSSKRAALEMREILAGNPQPDNTPVTFMGRATDDTHLIVEQERSGGRARAIGQFDLMTGAILWRTGLESSSASQPHYDFAALPATERVAGPVFFSRWKPSSRSDPDPQDPSETGQNQPFSESDRASLSAAAWSAGLHLAPPAASGQPPQSIALWELPGRALWPLAISPDRKVLAVLSLVTLNDSLAADEIIIVSTAPWRSLLEAAPTAADTTSVASPLILARQPLAPRSADQNYLQRLAIWSRQTMDVWPVPQRGKSASAIVGIADGSGGLLGFDPSQQAANPGLFVIARGHQASAITTTISDDRQPSNPRNYEGLIIAKPTGLWWLRQAPSIATSASTSGSTTLQQLRIYERDALVKLIASTKPLPSMYLLEPDARPDRVALRLSMATFVDPAQRLVAPPQRPQPATAPQLPLPAPGSFMPTGGVP